MECMVLGGPGGANLGIKFQNSKIMPTKSKAHKDAKMNNLIDQNSTKSPKKNNKKNF